MTDTVNTTSYLQRTILFAEDNDELREITDYFLSTMGFRVVACGDGDLAAAAFTRNCAIDLLLTDQEMPGRSGIELARDLTALRPSLPVMIVSGSILSDELLREIQARNWTFIPKPCQLTALLASLELALLAPRQQAA